MYDARRISILGWVLTALLGCAVGSSDGPEGDPVTPDAGADSAVEGDASDGEDEPDAGPGAGGSGGSGGAEDDSGPDGGTDGDGGGGGSGGSDAGDLCEPPNGGTCDPVEQCGCSANQNCDFITLDGKTACVQSGSTPAYGACQSTTQCQPGFSCVGGLCRPYCTSVADCPGPGRTCDQVYGGSQSEPIPGFSICSAFCDPVNPAGTCGPGATCLAFGGENDTNCFVAGTATGGNCTGDSPDECAPGYICAGPVNGTPNCKKWCRMGQGDCATCVGFTNKVILNGIEYGVCQ